MRSTHIRAYYPHFKSHWQHRSRPNSSKLRGLQIPVVYPAVLRRCDGTIPPLTVTWRCLSVDCEHLLLLPTTSNFSIFEPYGFCFLTWLIRWRICCSFGLSYFDGLIPSLSRYRRIYMYIQPPPFYHFLRVKRIKRIRSIKACFVSRIWLSQCMASYCHYHDKSSYP